VGGKGNDDVTSEDAAKWEAAAWSRFGLTGFC